MVNVPWCHDCNEPLSLCKCNAMTEKQTDAPRYGLTKEEWRTVAEFLNPALSEKDYDRMWDAFCRAKEEAEQMKAQGIAIHPTYGHKL